MNRIVACLGLGAAVFCSVASAGLQGGPSLGGPTVLGTSELPMPEPLSQLPPSPAPLSSTTVPLTPVPEIQYNGPVGQLPVVQAGNVELFPCVKVRDPRKIAPCATPIIVQVPDPCTPRRSCCPRPCVNVEICVPNCGCPTVCVTRNGNKTRYDYGKYAVDIVSLNGRIIVDYDN